MKKRTRIALSIGSLFVLAGCNAEKAAISDTATTANSPPEITQVARWYSQSQVSQGDALFQTHCASCHKPDASGTPDWREADAQGKYPPPPLNGTAHTWHHPLSVLQRTVIRGGVPLGGSMPGFGDKLTIDEINAILAWVQSNWPEPIYAVWHQRNEQASRHSLSTNNG